MKITSSLIISFSVSPHPFRFELNNPSKLAYLGVHSQHKTKQSHANYILVTNLRFSSHTSSKCFSNIQHYLLIAGLDFSLLSSINMHVQVHFTHILGKITLIFPPVFPDLKRYIPIFRNYRNTFLNFILLAMSAFLYIVF